MSNPTSRAIALALAAGVWISWTAPASADCPPRDLTVVLSTGWDEDAGTVIPAGGTDDDWDVTVDASAGVVPRDADVITPHPAWLTMANSQWISADKYGPVGTYRYQTCWCLDDDFTNPNLSFAIRADDKATVLLNGTLILTLPDGTFNDATPIGISANPALLHVGENCLDVVVQNLHGVVTGFNLVGTVTADDGQCCDCDESDIVDNASTGVADATGGLIASGADDDEWVVTAAASGGVLPRPAGVVNTFAGWNVIPGTKWISANLNGQNGSYVYEKCWCMNPLFEDAQLSMQLLADDRADVFLNGTLIGSTPLSNAFLFPATSISTSDQSLFKAGENCVTIDVTNASAVVTGLDVAMTITATNAECCPCAELPPDAEGWWPLNETVGPTAADSLNGHDGTWNGSGSPPPPIPLPGVVDFSLLLDGIDDHAAVPDHPGLDFGPGQDFSFDAWIKTSTGTRQAIIHKKVPGAPTAAGYSFDTAGVLSLEVADGTNVHVCVGTLNVADGDWHFVAATVDRTLAGGMVMKLYVNGFLDQTCTATSAFTGSLANAQQLYFGAAPMNPVNAQLWWKGQLDEIEIFRRALTADQVYDIFIAYDSGKCPAELCADSTGVPICAGICPTGSACVAGSPPAAPCQCVQQTATCGATFPACNGPCPDADEVCVDVGNGCDCVAQAIPCGDPLYPACDGACPANQACQQTANQGCTCITCGTGSVVVGFAAHDEILWTPVACALVYNVYRGIGVRLRDQNADGLADDYGSCYIGDIIGTHAPDPGNPQGGAIHWYLVTGEDFTAEGPLGNNSSGQPRQATSPCP